MFDLMGAIRKRQQTPSTASEDFAETAELAENGQPRASEHNEGLRRTADFSKVKIPPAIICNHPQGKKSSCPPQIKGPRELSVNPQNPQTRTGKNEQNPEAVLLELAHLLKGDPSVLRALLSDDDMQAIGDGEYSWGYLLDYFRLMRSDGIALVSSTAKTASPPESADNRTTQKKPWEAAHDAMIDHLMTCSACYAPRGRYCSDGERLRHDYLATYHTFVEASM